MVVMLRQCCCGCSLKTGTIIIGVLNLIYAILLIASGAVVAGSKITPSDKSEASHEYEGIGIASAVFGAVILLIAILLLVGAAKNKPALLMPWIIMAIVLMVATTIINLIQAGYFFKNGDTTNGISYIIGTIIGDLLEVYFILVVYSLYREQRGTA